MNRRRLYILAPAMLIASVSFASAQQPPPQPPPMPPTPAALSVPDPLAGFRPGPRDLYRLPGGSDRFQHLTRYPVPPAVFTPGVYVPGPFDYFYGSPYPYPSPYSQDMRGFPQRRYEAIERGGLVLQTIPDAAQVFVDGYYVGLAEEFGLHGRPMDISAGAHRIELRAPNYETLAFSVSIGPNDIVRYRGDMQPLSTKPTAMAATAPPSPTLSAPKSFYVIPNCYAGDKPPSRALPKGCDVKKLQTRK